MQCITGYTIYRQKVHKQSILEILSTLIPTAERDEASMDLSRELRCWFKINIIILTRKKVLFLWNQNVELINATLSFTSAIIFHINKNYFINKIKCKKRKLKSINDNQEKENIENIDCL